MLKEIEGFENYAVNEEGQIWSYNRGHFLKPYPDGHGYLKVSLYKDCICYRRRVHRLVMEAFNPVEGMENLEVNHLNEQKEDNRLENLEWCTHKENCNYGSVQERRASKLRIPVEQYTLDGKLVAEYDSLTSAAKATGCNASKISSTCRKTNGTLGGYIWRYKENGKSKESSN